MKLLVVLHTHWDREWYFTTSDSLVLMDRTFKNIIHELQLYPKLNFCLDGQYSIIEEFLTINPDLEMQVKQLVTQGRLDIGPWYTQTDSQLVSGESVIRNLYYGSYQSRKRFGRTMEVGYLPDTFGFNNELPEILKVAGINKAIIWRGTKLGSDLKPYFKWAGPSGDVVDCINLYGGYGMAKGLDASLVYNEQILNKLINDYSKLGIESTMVLPVGNDQYEIVPDILEKIEEINKNYNQDLVMSNYEKVFDEIFTGEEEQYVGEFRATQHTRVHKSIGSVRMDLKTSNYEAEQLLLNQVEPLMAYCHYNQIDTNPNLLYTAWKLLFEGHAHDGICGCISDDVALDMANRIKRATEIGHSIINILSKQIAEIVGLEADEILLFNPSAYKKTIHQVTFISEHSNIGILEVEDYEVINSQKYDGKLEALVETPTGNHLETQNDYYEHTLLIRHSLDPMNLEKLKVVAANQVVDKTVNNSLTIKDYQLNFCHGKLSLNTPTGKIDDFISLTHEDNDGDTYDFSPLNGENEIRIDFTDCKTSYGDIQQKMVILGDAMLRASLKDHSLVANPFTLTITVIDNRLDVSLEFENNVKSHRIRVALKSLNNITHTISSNSNSIIKRDTNQKLPNDWELSNVEKPINIEVFDGYLTANELTIINGNSREYEVLENNLYLTCFSTTSQLGKSNLVNRPGRASGDISKKGHIKIATPLAECQKTMKMQFGIIIGECNNPMLEVQNYRYQAISYHNQECNKFYYRIDNKIMPYRKLPQRTLHFPTFISNGLITNIGFNLNYQITFRGIAVSNNYLKVDDALLASKTFFGDPNLLKPNNIFNYEMENDDY